MAQNVVMKYDTWLEYIPKIIEVYWALLFTSDNHQWNIIDIFDGFGAQMCNQDSLKMRLGVNIISIKEEFDSYPINQAYNK